jgi:hypothetical protein
MFLLQAQIRAGDAGPRAESILWAVDDDAVFCS